LLDQPLAELVARRSAMLGFAPTHADLAIDRLLTHSPTGPLSFDNAVALLRLLAGGSELRLDGEKARRPAALYLPASSTRRR
jgi:hypothetical protein